MADTILFVLGFVITLMTVGAVFLVGTMPRPDEPAPNEVPAEPRTKAPDERGGDAAAR